MDGRLELRMAGISLGVEAEIIWGRSFGLRDGHYIIG